jgi:hypothetical protein
VLGRLLIWSSSINIICFAGLGAVLAALAHRGPVWLFHLFGAAGLMVVCSLDELAGGGANKTAAAVDLLFSFVSTSFVLRASSEIPHGLPSSITTALLSLPLVKCLFQLYEASAHNTLSAEDAFLGGVDGLGRVWGEWIPKFVDL